MVYYWKQADRFLNEANSVKIDLKKTLNMQKQQVKYI